MQAGVPDAPAAQLFDGVSVNFTDGVDREEARRLAGRYFAEFHGACGGVDYAGETPDSWSFSTVVGFAAAPGEAIVVRKDGTRISQKGSPDVVRTGDSWTYKGANFFGEEGGG